MARGQIPANDDAGVWLWRASNAWVRRVRAALKPHGLTHAQFLLLAGLAHLEGHRPGAAVTQSSVAALTGVDVTAASTVIRDLAANGLVTRTTGTDARARELSLTPDGRKHWRAASHVVETEATTFFAPLGTNLSAFAGALRALTGVRTRVTAPTSRAPTS